MDNYNNELINKNYIYDMNIIPVISTEEFNKLLYIEEKKYYYNHKEINKNIIKEILLNRNMYTRYKVKRGLVINRCYGKLLPSDIILYSNINDTYFDRNQQLELDIGLPIYILHISKDKKWYFIKTYNYYCWINKKDICIVNENIFNQYLNPKRFIITTDKLYLDNNKYIDMGTKLPLYNKIDDNYKVILPSMYNNKYVEEIIDINNHYVNEGYLRYSNHNLIKQALKYLNISYGWGGINNGIDCSGLIVHVFKVFGILLPRDTDKQQEIVGTKIINMKNLNLKQKYEQLIKYKENCIIYFKNHVMILLKIYNTNIYVIHSSSNYRKVIITKLDNETINNITSLNIVNFDKN